MKKGWRKDVKAAVKTVKAAGRTGADGVRDTEIIHLNKSEMPIVDRALKRYGGSGKTNPKTGAKEYGLISGGLSASREAARQGIGQSKGSQSGDRPSQTVPTKSTGPTPANDTFGSPESAAASSLGAGGSQPLGSTAAPNAPQAGNAEAPNANTTGFSGLDKPKPAGAVDYQKGADALGVAGSIGIAAGAGRALTQGLTGKDPLADHMGHTVGYSEDPGMTPGRDRSQRGAKLGDSDDTTKPAAAPKPATPKPTSASSAYAGGFTQTVNPDGTIRYNDTSVAGLRAQRRYGATSKPAAA